MFFSLFFTSTERGGISMQQEYAYSSGYDESLYAVPPPVVYVSSTRSTSYPFKLLGLTGGFLLVGFCL